MSAHGSRPLVTANRVTFARLMSMPVMVWLFYQGRTGQWWAFGLGAVIAATDFVDGYLARKHGPTVLGGLMDPIADKVFIAVVFLAPTHLGWLPAWPVALMFVREMLITGLRTMYERRGISMKTSYLAKVKTWVQMQAAATMIFFVLIDDRSIAWPVLLSGTAGTLVVVGGLAVVRRRIWRGGVIMFFSMVLLDLVFLPSDLQVTIWVMTLLVVLATWASGLDYLIGGVRQLRGRGDVDRIDLVRLIGGVTIPCVLLAAVAATDAPMWILVSILSVELAVGGLDNLLAHHRANASAIAWGLRALGTAALLGGAVWASWAGQPAWVVPLASAALIVSTVGSIREFWRGRTYYIDALG